MQALWRFVLLLLLVAPVSGRCELAIGYDVSPLPTNGPLTRGQATAWTFTITNTGDEVITLARAGTNYVEKGPGRTLFVYPNASTPPCGVQYTDFGGSTIVFVTAEILFTPMPLNPGESRSCTVDLVIAEDAPSFFSQEFGFLATIGPRSVTGTTFLPFQVDPVATPIPAQSTLTLAALALLLFAVGAMAVGRSSSLHSSKRTVRS